VSVASIKQQGWWRYRYWLTIVLFFAYSIQYADRVKTSVLAPLIMKDIHMSAIQYGNGMSLMLLFYGLFQFVVGWICDIFGAKKVLIFSLVTWAILTWWMAYMHSTDEWYIRQILFGILCSTEFVPSARLIAGWFPKRQRAQAEAGLTYSWILTPAWAPLVATALVAALGSWRPAFMIVALFAVFPLLAIIFWVSNRPEQRKGISQQELEEIYEDEIRNGIYTADEIASKEISHEKIQKRANVSWGQIFRCPGFIQICCAYIVIEALQWATTSFIPLYLKETFSFSMGAMGIWTSIFFAGGVVGSFIGSTLSDKFFAKRRHIVLSIAFGGAVPFLIILALLQKGVNPVVLLFGLTLCGFFCNAGWGSFYAWTADVFSSEVFARALGIINTVGYLIGAAGAPLVMAHLIVKTATGGVSYTWSWLFISLVTLIGFLLAITMKEAKEVKTDNIVAV
jgi:sugar phosphate permease